MILRLTNTLTGKKETFEPLVPGKLKMYTCGPTVYGLTHIGNARPAVFFDVARRFFEASGYDVTWVMNFTDVDDKIINRAREEKITASAVAEKYTHEYLADLHNLGVRLPTKQPKVTDTIPQIIALIGKLIANQSAYVSEDGEVFFSVRGFAKYGQLSGKKIDELRIGARIAPDEKKRDPLDFSLWKPQKAEDEPAWTSPWGKGRPGWHIECSAMAIDLLGETFDIHGGGLDLIHPHHENEIAQSEGATGKLFARYWMHNNLISIHKEKMSKSLGNIFLTRDFIHKYSAETLRYLLLSSHYRSPVEFSESHIQEMQGNLHRIYSAKKKAAALSLQSATGEGPESPEEGALKRHSELFGLGWNEALADDFNFPKALALVFDYVRLFNALVDKKGFKATKRSVALAGDLVKNLDAFSQVSNLFGESADAYLAQLRAMVLRDRGIDAAAIEMTLTERQQARVQKDFAKADRLRDELLSQGIAIKDTPQGTEWDVIFAYTASASA